MNLAKIVKAARKFDQEEREKGNSPPEIHQDLLIKYTKKICEESKADVNLALIGAYLMDIKVGKAWREGRVEEHVEMGLRAARRFLKKFRLSKDIQDKIENIIQAHHGTIPYQSPEAEIVANADCFRFLHPKGATYFLTSLGKRGLKFSEALKYFEYKVEEKHNTISLDICKEEAEEYYKLLKKLISLAKKSY
jgi:HD superfamily phosphodiesterase